MRPLFASILLLFACACGGSGSDPSDTINAGYSSLNSGSHSEALASFQSALAGMKETDGMFLEAKVGELKALCYLDAAKAKEGLMGLAKSTGVEPSHYRSLVDELVAAAAKQAGSDADAANVTIAQALEILSTGKQTFPEYEKWQALINKVGDKAKAFGNPDTMAALKGLGYIGD